MKTTKKTTATTKPATKPTEPVIKLPDNYSSKADARKRMTFKIGTQVVAMIQPCRSHYTVYISKHVLTSPETATAMLTELKYKCEAVINPTYKLKEGKDPFSVKATVTDVLPSDLEAIGQLFALAYDHKLASKPAEPASEPKPAKPAKKSEEPLTFEPSKTTA